MSVNQLSFKRKFVAALIDGIILNSGFGFILAFISSATSNIALPSLDIGNFEILLSLVYFAVLDSIPKQLRIGKKLVEIKLFNSKTSNNS